MTYRVICEFVPIILVGPYGRGKQRVRAHGRKGYWRVVACAQATPASAAIMRPVVLLKYMLGDDMNLVVSSHRPRQPRSICSPRKILAEWQEFQRCQRIIDENPWMLDGCERGPQVRPWDYDGDGLKEKDYML